MLPSGILLCDFQKPRPTCCGFGLKSRQGENCFLRTFKGDNVCWLYQLKARGHYARLTRRMGNLISTNNS